MHDTFTLCLGSKKTARSNTWGIPTIHPKTHKDRVLEWLRNDLIQLQVRETNCITKEEVECIKEYQESTLQVIKEIENGNEETLKRFKIYGG